MHAEIIGRPKVLKMLHMPPTFPKNSHMAPSSFLTFICVPSTYKSGTPKLRYGLNSEIRKRIASMNNLQQSFWCDDELMCEA